MLKLTKRTDYGLIAMRHLAIAVPRGGATAKEISDAYRIPLPLLSKVLQSLARGGYLAAEQGARGGYRLAREADEITALEVIRAIDGPVLLTSCSTHGQDCEQSETCTVKAPLHRVHEGILSLLAGITVADLSREQPVTPELYTVSAAPALRETLR